MFWREEESKGVQWVHRQAPQLYSPGWASVPLLSQPLQIQNTGVLSGLQLGDGTTSRQEGKHHKMINGLRGHRGSQSRAPCSWCSDLGVSTVFFNLHKHSLEPCSQRAPMITGVQPLCATFCPPPALLWIHDVIRLSMFLRNSAVISICFNLLFCKMFFFSHGTPFYMEHLLIFLCPNGRPI